MPDPVREDRLVFSCPQRALDDDCAIDQADDSTGAQRQSHIRKIVPGCAEERGHQQHGAEMYYGRRAEGGHLSAGVASGCFCDQSDHDKLQTGQRGAGRTDDDVEALPGKKICVGFGHVRWRAYYSWESV